MPNLVLVREKDESIVLNEEITSTILSHGGNRTRVAIEAPRSVTSQRVELQPPQSVTTKTKQN